MIIFLYGEDDFRSRRKLTEITEQYRQKNPNSFNFYTLDFNDRDAFDELKERVSGVSMFLEKKLFVLRNVFVDKNIKLKANFAGKEQDLLDFLKRNKLSGDKDIILTFWQTGAPTESGSLFKELNQKTNLVQKFDKLEGKKLEEWIIKEIKFLGGEISSSAVRFLIVAVGSDLWRMEQEIIKLVNYKNSGIIELEDAKKMVRTKIDSNVFSLIDAIAVRDKKTAMELARREIEVGNNEIYLMTMVAHQLRNLVKVSSCQSQFGQSSAQKLKMHPYVFKKTVSQLKNFSFGDLEKLYQKMFFFDLSMKTGRLPSRLALEMLIFEI